MNGYHEDLCCGPMEEEAGNIYPKTDESGYARKYSKSRDYMIGGPNEKGRVNDSANKNTDWSKEDVLNTGLILRQPI